MRLLIKDLTNYKKIIKIIFGPGELLELTDSDKCCFVGWINFLISAYKLYKLEENDSLSL